MVLLYTCPGCQNPLRLLERMMGKKLRCPRCQAEFVVPGAKPPPSPSPARSPEPSSAASALPAAGPQPTTEDLVPVELVREELVREGPRPGAKPPPPPTRVPPPRRADRAGSERTGPWRQRSAVADWVPAIIFGGLIVLLVVAGLVILLLGSGGRDQMAKKNMVFQPPPDVRPIEVWPPAMIKEGVKGDRAGPEIMPDMPVPPFVEKPKPPEPDPPGTQIIEDRLTQNDPRDQGRKPFLFHCKVYLLEMKGGRAYVIEQTSRQLQAFVHLDDAEGKMLLQGHDIPGVRPAQVQFTPPRDATYRIVASTVHQQQTGEFTLKIRGRNEGEPLAALDPNMGRPPPVKLPSIPLPASVAGSGPVGGENYNEGNISFAKLPSPGLPLCWSADGKAFFQLTPQGRLQKIALKGLAEERRLEIGRKCGSLAMSSAGLVVTLPDEKEVWLIDAGNLEVKRRIGVRDVRETLAAPGSALALAASPGSFGGEITLTILDLSKGEALREQHLSRCTGRGPAFTPDGKHFLIQHDDGELHRYRLANNSLIFEEKSPKVCHLGEAVCVSPDSKYVCVPSNLGNYAFPGFAHTNSTTYAFAVESLQRPAFAIPGDRQPRLVAFNPKAGHVYAQSDERMLLVFDMKGRRLGEQLLGTPRASIDHPRQFLPHPDGDILLVRSEKHLFVVNVKGGEGPSLSQTQIVEDRLTQADAKDKVRVGAFCKVYLMEMKAGRTYVIDHISSAFDAYLRIEDSAGKNLAEDDDGGGSLNARLIFTPVKNDAYRIIATSLTLGRTGAFLLKINGRLANEPEAKLVPPPPPPPPNRPTSVGTVIAQDERRADDLRIRLLVADGTPLHPVWDATGKYLYLVSGKGTLHRVRTKDYVIEDAVLLEKNAQDLALSAEGLLVRTGGEILLVDTKTLEVKNRFAGFNVAASPALSLAALLTAKGELEVLDLKKGAITPSPLEHKIIPPTRTPAFTSEGKWLWALSTNRLLRFRVENGAFRSDGEFDVPPKLPMQVVVSAEGKLLALLPGALRALAPEDSQTHVYAASAPGRPLASLSGVKAIILDAANNRFWSLKLEGKSTTTCRLVLFDAAGKLLKEYDVVGQFRQLVPGPDRESFIIVGTRSYLVDWPRKKG